MATGLLITTSGQLKITQDLGGGTDLVLTHVAIGDASGVPYTPVASMTQLVNERYRATISSVAVVSGAIVVDAVIPADTNDAQSRPSHGFNLAEVGLFSNDGTLIGVAALGNGYKPPPSSGQASEVTIRLQLAVANPSSIAVTIDTARQIHMGRHVQPFWMTVDGALSAPPASPAMGDTYLILPTATGAWAGYNHYLAQWVGVWILVDVPVGHMISDRSLAANNGNFFRRRIASGWESGIGTATAYGFARRAAAAAAAALTDDFDFVTPLGVREGMKTTGLQLLKTENGPAITDVNDVDLRSGFYRAPGGTPNLPFGYAAGLLHVFRGTTGYGLELFAAQDANEIAARRIDNNTLGPWFKLVSEAMLTTKGFEPGMLLIAASGSFNPATYGIELGSNIVALLWGAGGGGNSQQSNAGGAGGGGGFAAKVVPAAVTTVTIGTGGVASTTGIQAGNGGTTSWGAVFSATGGGGAGGGGGIPGGGVSGDLNLPGASGDDMYGTGHVFARGGSAPLLGTTPGLNAAGASYGGGGSAIYDVGAGLNYADNGANGLAIVLWRKP